MVIMVFMVIMVIMIINGHHGHHDEVNVHSNGTQLTNVLFGWEILNC